MLFATVGMMVMVSATNMMTLYLGLELQSLALYVLAAFARDELRSSEAGLKYFVLGALASGLLLYGISLVYGFSGTMDFAALAQRADRSGRRRRPAWSSASCSSSPASPSRSRPCRSTCGRPTSTKARRRRSPRSWAPRRRSPPSRCCCASWWRRSAICCRQWQQIIVARLHRLDAARRARRDRADATSSG